MRQVALALVTCVVVAWGAPAVAAPDAPPTVVSITFGGTFASQARAAEILSAHGMSATFYINSGYIDSPAHLSIAQLRTIGRDRQEVAGASLYGNDLSDYSPEEASRQVCDDRATLAQLGFQVTSFAYPHGVATPEVKAAVQDCGYNSARDYAGLFRSATDCSSCPPAESMPPNDDFRVRTTTASNRLAMEHQVIRAERGGGGWVTLTFTRVCVCAGTPGGSMTPEDFDGFLTWLSRRPPSTVVRTVDQVMSGPLKPVHGTAIKRLVRDPSPAVSTPQALSKVPAWTVFGVGVGQAQLLVAALVLSLTIVVTFRVATRGNRYGR